MREHSGIERLVVLVVLYGLIGVFWCIHVLGVQLSVIPQILDRGCTVNLPWYHMGTALISLSVPAALATGLLTRRLKSLKTSLIVGIAALVTFFLLGSLISDLAVTFP